MMGVSNKCISLQKLNNLIPNNRLKNLTQLTGETNTKLQLRVTAPIIKFPLMLPLLRVGVGLTAWPRPSSTPSQWQQFGCAINSKLTIDIQIIVSGPTH